MRPAPKETPVWWTALKIIALLAALIAGVGLALWAAGQKQQSVDQPAVSAPSQGWGIAGDSPIRSNR